MKNKQKVAYIYSKTSAAIQEKQLYSSVHSLPSSRKRRIILAASHLNWFYADEKHVNLDRAMCSHAEHLFACHFTVFRGLALIAEALFHTERLQDTTPTPS